MTIEPDALPGLDPARLVVPALRPASSFGLTVVEYLPDASTGRDQELEALWYELSHPSFGTLGLVPVTPLWESDSIMMVAAQLAAVGASVSRQPVVVIDGTRVIPSEAETAVHELTRIFDAQRQCIVVAQSPTVEPGSIPLLEACDRIVLVVGLGSSRRTEGRFIEEMLQRTPVVGAVCLPVSTRRSRRRRRRSARSTSIQPQATMDSAPIGDLIHHHSSSGTATP